MAGLLLAIGAAPKIVIEEPAASVTLPPTRAVKPPAAELVSTVAPLTVSEPPDDAAYRFTGSVKVVAFIVIAPVPVSSPMVMDEKPFWNTRLAPLLRT